jgi:hypothetical protein
MTKSTYILGGIIIVVGLAIVLALNGVASATKQQSYQECIAPGLAASDIDEKLAVADYCEHLR